MASKKRTVNTESVSPAPLKPDKRQRVTCACDPCRLAREKCDGSHPSCMSCTDQKRECRYTQTVKKRGVPTGYLKTIELSLAWLIEENPRCEMALQRLLGGGIQSARLLQCLSHEGHRLQQRWSRSSVHESIGKLLSHDIDRSKEFPEDSGTESDGQDILSQDTSSDTHVGLHTTQWTATPQLVEAEEPIQPSIKLPLNWKKLIEIYRKNTHCWFPLVSMSDVIHAASTYPNEGIKQGLPRTPAVLAELWAVLALAAFQDTSSDIAGSIAPPQIYSTARGLVPSEDETFESPHLRAMLLHSLVLIGQGEELAAWLLVGTATKLSMHLKCSGLLLDDGEPPAGHRMRAACFILDILTSASLGYSSTFDPDSASILETQSELHRWQKIGTSQMMPQKSFYQLFRFCCFMGQRARGTQLSLAGISDLVKSLDPSFAFCNNVLSDSESLSPSALLIQVAFFVTTVHLSHPNGFRLSLATNLIEVVECCTKSLGLRGTPPLAMGLLGIFRRSQHFGLLHQSEKVRWQTVTDNLRAAWGQQKRGSSFMVPVVQNHDCTFSQMMEMRSGLLSPDLSTLSNPEYETQSSSQYISSSLETPNLLLKQPQDDFELDALFCSSILGHTDPISGSFCSEGDGTVSGAMDDNVISEDLDTFASPSELGVDARLISNLGFGALELDALSKVDSSDNLSSACRQ